MSAGDGASRTAMRIVLDTNVWLDWLVFADPSVTPLKAANTAGRLEIIRSLPGEQELQRVLDYKAIEPLVGAALRPLLMTEMRRLSRLHDGSTRDGWLPQCRDADDQPFLALARDSGAAALVTKDRDLLELARAKHRVTAFRIVTPKQFVAHYAALLPALQNGYACGHRSDNRSGHCGTPD